MAAAYAPRSPTIGVLYGVVCMHLTEFLAAVDTDGGGLPGFVVDEFRKFLHRGVLALNRRHAYGIRLRASLR